MKVHFIAICGSAMHNLAIALAKKGYEVSGSDDEFFEPAKSRLRKYDLLPGLIGWHPELLTPQLDAVIVGMHAKADNPELIRAQQLGLKIYSYPEYLYEQSKNKKRIVIGGSHGKTTITAMILHVLQHCKIDCDYMVGAQLEGFDVMVKLSEDAPLMVFEGDEYLTSPIDRRPKFHVYKPDIALISGIAWDHINVFPTFDNYVEQFRIFAGLISNNGALVYCNEDVEVVKIADHVPESIQKYAYKTLSFTIENGITYLNTKNGKTALQIFGKHNLCNLAGAKQVCNLLGVSDELFFNAIASFKGASKRLELIAKNDFTAIYKDFAHSPSKLMATTKALKEQYPGRKLVACMELHTYSSLNKDFLSQYQNTLEFADVPLVYFNHHALAIKKLPPISSEQVFDAFNNPDLQVFTDSSILRATLLQQEWKNCNLLMMSSGNFDGISLDALAENILAR
ncbi:MAG: Mur ligase family protein [Lentimicrobiaceae bacterium]|nr:Mur ligase family protein [Lentimicrobiaceae bacterium]